MMDGVLRYWLTAPQPMPVLFVLFVVVFAMNFALGLTGHSSDVLMFVLGGTALAVGVLLALNVRGAASHHSTYLKQHRIRGIDYSTSYRSNPLYVRLVGAGLVVVGAVFMVVSATA